MNLDPSNLLRQAHAVLFQKTERKRRQSTSPMPSKKPRTSAASSSNAPASTSKPPVDQDEKLISDANELSMYYFQARFLPTSSPLLSFTSPRLGTSHRIVLTPSLDLSDAEFEACFRLMERTSSAAYKASSRGWHPKEKRVEMREQDMRYLLVTSALPTSPLPNGHFAPASAADAFHGFLSFMLTIEDDYPVIYIYEVHLAEALRSSGLGSHLMGIAETIGQKVGVQKSMLTVFSSNEGAERFYRRLGYEVDEFSPEPRILRGGRVKKPDYWILSKALK